MKKISKPATMLTVAILFAGLTATAHAQQQTAGKVHFRLAEVAGTYDIEHAKIAASSCNCFWLNGGSGEVAVRFYPAWSLVGSFAGSHASDIAPGVDLNRLTWLVGPRFSYNSSRFTGEFTGRQESRLFAEVLIGSAHGFDSVFPAGGGTTSSANSYAFETGGGLELAPAGGLHIRPLQIDYVRTALPNSVNNTQNDLRLAFGLGYSFGKL